MGVKYMATTRETQGERKSDFHNGVEDGQPIVYAFECDSDRDNVDGRCGCRRSMKGVDTGGGTTTFIVMESDNPNFYEELHAKIKSSLITDWAMTPADADEEARIDVLNLEHVSGQCEVGTIVEKRGDDFRIRRKESK